MSDPRTTLNRTIASKSNVRELGRASGRARRERKQKTRSRSFIDALRDLVRENPDELAGQLMSTAAGAVAGVRLLEKAGDFEPPREEQPGPLHAGGAIATPSSPSSRRSGSSSESRPATQVRRRWSRALVELLPPPVARPRRRNETGATERDPGKVPGGSVVLGTW